MPEKRLVLRLFDPGMTHFHRVGLAGLYMTLKCLNPEEFEPWGGWVLGPRQVELYWSHTPKDLLGPITKKAFGISQQGAVQYLAHAIHPMGDLEKLSLHQAILLTYLQHGRTRKLAARERTLAFDFDGKMLTTVIKPIENYQNQQALKFLFNQKGCFKKEINLAGWLLPGGAVRHVIHSEATTLKNSPEKFLLLLFAPVASLYFLISHRTRDGKYDQRRLAALVLPHITDLETFNRSYQRFLQAPVQRLYVYGMGDAGLSALTMLNVLSAEGFLESLEINSCSVVTMGTLGWAKQQKTRTGIMTIKDIDAPSLHFYDLALKILPNKKWIKEDGKLFCYPSIIRGLIADNIAASRRWYANFSQLMQSKKLAGIISWERKELNTMVQEAQWSPEEDRLLVEAVHQALRNRYGALAQRAKLKGEVAQFGKEFERLRASLMRTKNAATLRAELADLFARGGLNQVLQGNWQKLLGLFTGGDWQRARDLALLALASYVGKGVEELEIKEPLDREEE
ncbi:MAG: type I-MYXAN CRISPR-associated Cas8a1/Cmx1 [Desulfobacca sp.]|nr:type I-MYXAN CRISPR-associated Cas8a1/Cmx1 [Desulfobacca sp.]